MQRKALEPERAVSAKLSEARAVGGELPGAVGWENATAFPGQRSASLAEVAFYEPLTVCAF